MFKGRKGTSRDGTADSLPDFPVIPVKLALIARDRTVQAGRPWVFASRKGFAPHFASIARACSRAGCDTLLFALWSHNENTGTNLRLRKAELFPPGSGRVAVVFLGLTMMGKKKEEIRVWLRERSAPFVCHQRFGTSSDSTKDKTAFVDDLPNRQFGDTLLVLCGETNIINTCRASARIADAFGVLHRLGQRGVKVILNPCHTYMHRFEMNVKRQALSRKGRYCISVWNRGFGAGSEARNPWTAFHDGKDITEEIQELPALVEEVPGLRIGTLCVR